VRRDHQLSELGLIRPSALAPPVTTWTRRCFGMFVTVTAAV
jgi:hypothetical protein